MYPQVLFVTKRILVRLDQEIRKSHDHIRYQNVSSKVRFDLGIQKNYVMVNRTKAVLTWRGYISYPQAYPQMPDRDTKKLITVVTKVYPKFRYCSVSSNLNCDTSWKVVIVTKCILNSFFVTRRILVWLDQEIRKSQDHIRYQNVSSKVRFDLGIHKNYVMVNRTKAVFTWRGYISYPQAYPQAPDWDTKKLITVVKKLYPKFR